MTDFGERAGTELVSASLALPRFDDLIPSEGVAQNLLRLSASEATLFTRLFEDGSAVPAGSLTDYPHLTSSRLLDVAKGQAQSRFRVFIRESVLVVSDWRSDKPLEVFRPWTDEVAVTAPFFRPAARERHVLDLGCGSGIYSLLAARAGAHVVAVDCSERALAAAKFGARISGVADRIAFHCGDMYAAITGRFDLIMAGLPYRPTPPAGQAKVYADGGPTGLQLIERAFRGAAAHLAVDGRCNACCMSLGDRDATLVEQSLPGWLDDTGVWHLTSERMGKPTVFADWWLAGGGSSDGVAGQWLAGLYAAGLTHFHRVRLTAQLRGRH